MRHFSSALGWDVYLGCLLSELCLIFKTKKNPIGTFSEVPTKQWITSGNTRAFSLFSAVALSGRLQRKEKQQLVGLKGQGWERQWGCGELIRRVRKSGTVLTPLLVLITALISTAPRSWHFLRHESQTISLGSWPFTGWINLRHTMLFKSGKKKEYSIRVWLLLILRKKKKKYTHTHTHTHTPKPRLWRERLAGISQFDICFFESHSWFKKTSFLSNDFPWFSNKVLLVEMRHWLQRSVLQWRGPFLFWVLNA